MDSSAEPAPGPAASLSKEGVLRAAVELADARGIATLSMRNLARALGVGVMSLYYYVANKSDLLDGIVDRVVGEIDPPPAAATGGRRSGTPPGPRTRSCCDTRGRPA